MIKDVSVIGLGKLGASMAAGMASRGFSVIGVDIDRRAVEAINAGRAPVQETGLDEMISENRERLRATLSHVEAIVQSDISFVIVPTPSDARGAFSLQYAAFAFREIGRALAKKDGYHVVVLTSTVLPGSTRYGLLPILERESGKRCGPDFGLCYSPEFIALGSVIRDFLNPDFYLIGEFDRRSGDMLQSVDERISMCNSPCRRMTLENAELAKIALNSFVTMKISFANMLADLCERIPGGDVDAVSNALGMDTRIGRKYLTGGLGYGGPCFPRDNVAISFLARELGAADDLPATTDRVNRAIADRVVKDLQGKVEKGATVAVLGLSYKPFSHVVEESQGIMLARALADNGYRVLAYDPLANEAALKELHYRALILSSAEECLREAEVILITTPDPCFKLLTADDLLNGKSQVMVVDFWRILKDELTGRAGIQYIPGGCCVDEAAAEARLRCLWEGVCE